MMKVFTVALFLGAPVSAQTVAQKVQICNLAGDLASATTKARDSGVPLEKSQQMVKAAGGNLAILKAITQLVYVMNGVEAPVMQQVAIQMCQKNLGLK